MKRRHGQHTSATKRQKTTTQAARRHRGRSAHTGTRSAGPCGPSGRQAPSRLCSDATRARPVPVPADLRGDCGPRAVPADCVRRRAPAPCGAPQRRASVSRLAPAPAPLAAAGADRQYFTCRRGPSIVNLTREEAEGSSGLRVVEHAAFLAVPHKSQAEREILNSIFQSF